MHRSIIHEKFVYHNELKYLVFESHFKQVLKTLAKNELIRLTLRYHYMFGEYHVTKKTLESEIQTRT